MSGQTGGPTPAPTPAPKTMPASAAPTPTTLTLALMPPPPGNPPKRTISDVTNFAKLLAITLVWITVALLLVYYAGTGGIGRFFSAIDLRHVEMFGVKLDMDRERGKLVAQLSEQQRNQEAGRKFVVDSDKVSYALLRAEINAGAIRGSRLLWVDDTPDSNWILIELLANAGINVVSVTGNDEAVKLLRAATAREAPFDAIVTDGTRPEDSSENPDPPIRHMRHCLPVYRAAPPEAPQTLLGRLAGSAVAAKFDAGDAQRMNVDVQRGKRVVGGFRLAEDISDVPAIADYIAVASPRIIMYSASNGDITYDPCFRTITRDTATLLHAIVSALEETRPPAVLQTPTKAAPVMVVPSTGAGLGASGSVAKP